ncbi:MAG: hypothetical protein IPL26_23530 [Leptospiraceae bacterium]|nr:hypothetical protein [Leptospiraceae bacterium]
MYFINSFFKKIFPSCVLFFLIINCEYYKAYKYNEEGIKELNETKLEDSKTSFYKSISYSYKSYIPTYNIGYTLLQQDDLPAAHEKFQQAIEANPEFKEALYNDGQTLYLWGKKEVNPDSCNTERAKLLWEQAMLRFNETAELTNAGDYKKPSLANIKFIQNEISKLDNLKENNCKNQSEEQNDPNSESDQGEQEQKNQSEDNQANNEDNSQDKKDSDQDGKDSKDNKDSGKDGKDSKDKKDSGKDGKDSKDSKDSGKDGKDSKDSKDSGKDGKDSKDKKDSGKDGKDSKDKKDSGKDGKDSKDSKRFWKRWKGF